MKTAAEWEKEIFEGLKEATGKDYKAWAAEIKKSGIEKRNDIIKWLKTEHGLKHSQANTIVPVYLNGGKLVYADSGNLLDEHFKGKEELRPLYEELKKAVSKAVKETKYEVKKGYTSLTDKREYAVIAVKTGELRVGMDLGDMKFDSYVQKAKTLGAMPRISHMVVVKEKKDIDKKLTDLLKKAYERVR